MGATALTPCYNTFVCESVLGLYAPAPPPPPRMVGMLSACETLSPCAPPSPPQDEVLVGVLSVRETLLYAAKLRLPGNMSIAEKVRQAVAGRAQAPTWPHPGA